jgi:hypothetical protein
MDGVFQSVDAMPYIDRMNRIEQATKCDWKAVATKAGAIADHFRLPWRFHARIVAARGAPGL